MAKRDTVAAIKAANSVELDENAYKQAELDQLLALAQAGKQTDFDVLRKQFDDDGENPDDNDTPDQAQGDSTPPEATVAEDNSTRKVKVNYANEKVAEGAGFIHPTSKALITGDRVVSVPDDEWTDTMIRDKTLTEVRK